VIWPGGRSGPTWAIGYDGGHNTRNDIARAWAPHPELARLLTTSGLTGDTARARVRAGEWRGVLTPWAMAVRAFERDSLPRYRALAQRAMPVLDQLDCPAQIAWVATVYNRGAGLTGDRRREMRVIAQECGTDTGCMAVQYRSMCRLWRGTAVEAGLCARYDATAGLLR
jgi:hypothetical protein